MRPVMAEERKEILSSTHAKLAHGGKHVIQHDLGGWLLVGDTLEGV